MKKVFVAFVLGVFLSVFVGDDGVLQAHNYQTFQRGDANSDGTVTASDAIFILNWLQGLGPAPACMDAADANDDGAVNDLDPIYLLDWLYDSGPYPPSPGPHNCGVDPTSDSLRCETESSNCS